MITLPTADPTQPPMNPAAPVLRDDLLNWQPPSQADTALDFVDGLGEPPD